MKDFKQIIGKTSCYFFSLMPLFLPWFYFDSHIDGMQRGIDIINKYLLSVMICLMVVAIIINKFIILMIFLHIAVYFLYFCFWYVPYIADFNILISIDTAHFGFYLSILINSLFVFLIKRRCKNDI